MSVTLPMFYTPLPRVTVAKIRKAMAASIRHWRRVVAGKDHNISATHCALCQLFHPACERGRLKCPVYSRSQLLMCGGTPYGRVQMHLRARHRRHYNIYADTCPKCHDLAAQELEYLKLAQKFNMPRSRPCRRKTKKKPR